ncbi:MAG: sugar O-acyltransferase [Gemmataceae bacterium]
MAQDIIILGTGGNAIDIAEAVESNGAKYRVCGFLDDCAELHGRRIGDWRILGPLSLAPSFADALFVNGIGSPLNFWRKPEIIAKTGLSAERFATVVHRQAWVSPSARLGRGVAVLAQASVCARAVLGDHVIVLPNAVVSHDDFIGDYCCIASGACLSGNVSVGRCSYIGARAAVRGYVRLGEQVLVGMGAVVVKDVSDNQVVVGTPARFLRPVLAA